VNCGQWCDDKEHIWAQTKRSLHYFHTPVNHLNA
jgi:hypothetical protein